MTRDNNTAGIHKDRGDEAKLDHPRIQFVDILGRMHAVVVGVGLNLTDPGLDDIVRHPDRRVGRHGVALRFFWQA